MMSPPASILVTAFAALLALAAGTPGRAGAQQVAARRLSARELPAGLSYRGSVEAARRWTDRGGDNLLLLTRTGEAASVDRDGARVISRELHAYHFVRQGSGFRLLWQVADYVRDCDVDIVLAYAPGSLQVTDVDADGIAESSFVYQLACMGGMDPADMKLILHEGAVKYAIRGSTDLRDLGFDYPPPAMRPDSALQRVPLLRAFAVQQWRRFVRTRRWRDGAPP